MKTSGKFFPEGGSNYELVEVEGNDIGVLTITSSQGEVIVQKASNEIKVADKLAQLPREISIVGHGLLIIEFDDAVNVWLDSNDSSGLIDKLENNTRLVVTSVILVPLFLYLIFKYLLPYSAIIFAEYVPQSAVNEASRQTVYVLEKTLFEPSNLSEEFQAEFQNRWLEISNKLELDYPVKDVQFRSSVMGPNALALPDGTIFMTDELVELFEYDTDLMAAVMLHEIGHVEHKHSMRMIAETLVTTLTLGYIFGDVSGILELFGGVTTGIVQNQFTQENEWEADNYAIDNLQKVGLPIDSFSKAMEKLSSISAEEQVGQQYFQSHPLTSERIKNANRLIEDNPK